MQVGGVAEVSTKIGCVTIPLASSSMMGHVDPNTFTISLSLANQANGPAVVTTCSYDASVDVTFYSPPMIDVLFNIVMGSVGNRLVSGELRKLANNLSFTLVDLSALGYLEKAVEWRIAQNYRPGSMLFGVQQATNHEPGPKPDQ